MSLFKLQCLVNWSIWCIEPFRKKSCLSRHTFTKPRTKIHFFIKHKLIVLKTLIHGLDKRPSWPYLYTPGLKLKVFFFFQILSDWKWMVQGVLSAALIMFGCLGNLLAFIILSKPGVNFINILCSAFRSADPKSTKRYWQLDWIFTLLGSLHVKALHKHVGEIDPRCTCNTFQKRKTDVFKSNQMKSY